MLSPSVRRGISVTDRKSWSAPLPSHILGKSKEPTLDLRLRFLRQIMVSAWRFATRSLLCTSAASPDNANFIEAAGAGQTNCVAVRRFSRTRSVHAVNTPAKTTAAPRANSTWHLQVQHAKSEHLLSFATMNPF